MLVLVEVVVAEAQTPPLVWREHRRMSLQRSPGPCSPGIACGMRSSKGWNIIPCPLLLRGLRLPLSAAYLPLQIILNKPVHHRCNVELMIVALPLIRVASPSPRARSRGRSTPTHHRSVRYLALAPRRAPNSDFPSHELDTWRSQIPDVIGRVTQGSRRIRSVITEHTLVEPGGP